MEYMDYFMMKNIYHCTPDVFYAQDNAMMELHKKFYLMECERKRLDRLRAQQQR